jgi:2-polyprenyl-3-methyl-5-hydroxy-6-metoxy-1,4-benzoquinol methylase
MTLYSMDKKQQIETLDYFRNKAANWAKNAGTFLEDKVNVIKQRNDFVLKVIRGRVVTSLALDIGCGTGDLACQIALMGIKVVGIDFAKEMVDIANNKAKENKCQTAKFICCNIFDYSFETDEYDVISANGFIEYISFNQLDKLLSLCWKSLKQGGSLVLGSRNRLFNIFSLNNFTQEEILTGNITSLLLEAIQIVKLKHVIDLIGFKTVPLQEEGMEHENTGIKVSTRYQFTPAQLVTILNNKGFEPVEIIPIHIHGTPTKFKNDHKAVHTIISNLLQTYSDNNTCLIPQSSSFMIHGIKR